MSEPFVLPAEQVRLKLRSAIAEVERELTGAHGTPGEHGLATGALLASWRRLVPLIEPEPEPERRDCPHCQRHIMKLATRCMYCLQKSDPPRAD